MLMALFVISVIASMLWSSPTLQCVSSLGKITKPSTLRISSDLWWNSVKLSR